MEVTSRAHYRKDIEKSRAQGRAAAKRWRARNPEKKRAAAKKYYAENRERIIERALARERANPERKREVNRAARYAKKYGITVNDFERMLAIQRNQCAICPAALTRRAHVDHDHNTGKVRALLCPACNVALGAVERTNGSWIGAAQIYLSQFRGVSVLDVGLWRGDWETGAAP